MNAPARSAQFDRASQQRRAMLAKIHVARKTLAMDEDDYRQILFDETGTLSAGDCSAAQLDKVLARLKRLGFQPLGQKGAAMHPMGRKARALWISLYHLGVVHNPSEQALEAFAARQLKCERMIWARQSDAYKLIEALKGMAERAGWRQMGIDGKKLPPRTLQSHLCEVILAKLQKAEIVPADWSLSDAAWRLCGIENGRADPWTAEDFGRLAAALGKKLREAGGAA